MTPSEKTVKTLKEQGYRIDLVQRWNPYAGKVIVTNRIGRRTGIRIDLFRIIDYIAIKEKCPLIGVQSCGKDFSGHDKKILESFYAPIWLSTGCKIQLWSWNGDKLKFKEYCLEDFLCNTKI